MLLLLIFLRKKLQYDYAIMYVKYVYLEERDTSNIITQTLEQILTSNPVFFYFSFQYSSDDLDHKLNIHHQPRRIIKSRWEESRRLVTSITFALQLLQL